MKPEWRTDSVVLLCKQIRETRDFSICPILADALQEAGCDDKELLDDIRRGLDDTVKEWRVIQIYSEESERSLLWLTKVWEDIWKRRVRRNGRQCPGPHEEWCLLSEEEINQLSDPLRAIRIIELVNDVLDGKASKSDVIDWLDGDIFKRKGFWDHFKKMTGRDYCARDIKKRKRGGDNGE